MLLNIRQASTWMAQGWKSLGRVLQASMRDYGRLKMSLVPLKTYAAVRHGHQDKTIESN